MMEGRVYGPTYHGAAPTVTNEHSITGLGGCQLTLKDVYINISILNPHLKIHPTQVGNCMHCSLGFRQKEYPIFGS